MFIAFLHNMTLIVTFAFLLLSARDFFNLRQSGMNRLFWWLSSQGIGLFTVGIMLEQFHWNGYVVDLRSVPLLLVSYIVGLRYGLLAGILPALYRYFQVAGGVPYFVVLLTIVVPILVGSFFHRYRQKTHDNMLSLRLIVIMTVLNYAINYVGSILASSFDITVWSEVSVSLLFFAVISTVIMGAMVNASIRRNVHEHELKTAIVQKKAILKSASEVAIIATNLDGIITIFNSGAEKILGYTEQEIVGIKRHCTYHDMDEIDARAKEMSQTLLTDISGAEVIHYFARRGQPDRRMWTWLRKDGSAIKVNMLISPMYNYDHQLSGFLGIAVDVTEEIRLRAELHQQFELLEAQNEEIVSQQEHLQVTLEKIESHRDLIDRILESSHEGMVMTNSQGLIHYANHRMHDYFGLEESLNGTSILNCCENIQLHMVLKNLSLEDEVKKIVSGEKDEIRVKFTVNSPTGEQRHYELMANFIDQISGQNREILFVFMDRTEQERLDEMKNDLISVISHELRTPLSSILGFIEILLNREIPKEKGRKYLEIVHREANRLTLLLNDFLDIQRMESGGQEYHFAQTDLKALVQNAIEQWQKKPHLIEIDMPEEDVFVRGDEQKLTQVLHNLISNAVKYSPGADKIHMRLSHSKEDIQVHVTDYGLGIPEKDMSRLFSKFYRVEHSDRMQIPGTGLGLSICKEIIQAHGGTIHVKSELGKGSTFSFYLKNVQLTA